MIASFRRLPGCGLGVCLLATLVLAGACDRASTSASTEVPAEAAQTVVSLQEIDCQSCGMSVVTALNKTSGVYEATFDRETAEVTVAYDAAVVGPAQFIAVAHDLGYRASEGPGQGAYTPEVVFPQGLDVVQISENGEATDIEAHRVKGKVTVFDFHAIWCGPCKKVDRHMLAVLRDHDDVALRKLNVVDWDSEVAKTYLRNVPNLPYVIVYGIDGKEVTKISGLKLDDLDAAIREGRRR